MAGNQNSPDVIENSLCYPCVFLIGVTIDDFVSVLDYIDSCPARIPLKLRQSFDDRRLIMAKVIPARDNTIFSAGPATDFIPVRKILFLSANPKNSGRLRLDEEAREIEEGLRRSKYRDRFEIHSKWASRIRDLRRALLDHNPQIIHFAGHGGTVGIVLENELGISETVSSGNLAALFKLFAETVECVILNSCYSEAQAVAISEHIEYVVGMRKAVCDKVAIEFSIGFYDALGAGKSVEQAFEFGCTAIFPENHELSEDYVPKLIKRKNLGPVNEDEEEKEQATTTELIDSTVILTENPHPVKKWILAAMAVALLILLSIILSESGNKGNENKIDKGSSPPVQEAVLGESNASFNSLGNEITVENGDIIKIEEHFQSTGHTLYWLCFVNEKYIWPQIPIPGPNISGTVSVPSDRYNGGKLLLIRTNSKIDAQYRDWLGSGSNNPLLKPGKMAVILETKINIR